MRPRLPLVLVMSVLLLVAAACSSESNESTSTAEAGTNEAPAAETPDTESVESTEPPATETSSTDAAPTTAAPPATDPPLAELELVEPGPYDVGVQTITITDPTRDRPLTVDVWFPIDDGADAPLHQYTLIPGVYFESPTAVDIAPSAISADAPFPLVVYSHGSGGLRYIASYYTEAIASHGYIVAAPDHTGNTAFERLAGTSDDGAVISLNRPQDVKAVIDAMLDPTSTETGDFVASVDPESIAVTGHSFGGFTAYAVATGFENDLGAFVADTRVDAIIPLAPATNGITDEALSALATPTLVMVGTNDQTTPPDPNVTRPWELGAGDPQVRVDLVDGQHNSFTDLCDYQTFLPTLGDAVPAAVIETIDAQAAEGCSPGDMPIERAKALTTTFAIDFLDSVFRGGGGIDPTGVRFPDDVVVMVE